MSHYVLHLLLRASNLVHVILFAQFVCSSSTMFMEVIDQVYKVHFVTLKYTMCISDVKRHLFLGVLRRIFVLRTQCSLNITDYIFNLPFSTMNNICNLQD